MKPPTALVLSLLALTADARAGREILDRLDDALTVSSPDGQFRARLSGTLDIEGYHLDRYAPGLLFTRHDYLFNPRLTLFLDAQLGAHVYAFVQARADRGFDPSHSDGQVRLDEYALRFTPWDDGRFTLQVGKFATVVGNWTPRHGSWDNPFITAPLPYENLTGIWDSAAVDSARLLFSWSHVRDPAGGYYGDAYADKILRNPIVWGPSYDSGLSVSGKIGKMEYAAEVKNAALSSRPETWDATQVQWQHPTVSGRLGFRPNPMWQFGVSASTGSYLRAEASPTLARGHGLDDYRQTVLAQDLAFAWRHWQVWAEFYEARFEIPAVGHADTFAYYVEAKYKFATQFFGALRWNQQFFADFGDTDRARWGRDIWRIDAALGYRPSAHTQLKLQYSLQHEDSAPRAYGNTLAGQFTLRF